MAKNVSAVVFNDNKLSWKMGVKKDSLKDAREFVIDVVIDCEGVTLEQAMKVCGSGQSLRVKIQDLCRKGKLGDLSNMEAVGLKLTWDEVYASRASVPADPEDLLMKLSKEGFVEFMEVKMGVSESQAIEIFNRKHNVVEELDNDDKVE